MADNKSVASTSRPAPAPTLKGGDPATNPADPAARVADPAVEEKTNPGPGANDRSAPAPRPMQTAPAAPAYRQNAPIQPPVPAPSENVFPGPVGRPDPSRTAEEREQVADAAIQANNMKPGHLTTGEGLPGQSAPEDRTSDGEKDDSSVPQVKE